MIRHRFAVLAALACLGATPVEAQQPTARQVDSLAAEVRALKARLDSVRTALAGAGRQARVAPAAKDTAATDELAALRSAARAAAGSSDTTARQETTPTPFTGPERKQAHPHPRLPLRSE